MLREKAGLKAATLRDKARQSIAATRAAIARSRSRAHLPTLHEITSRLYGAWLPVPHAERHHAAHGELLEQLRAMFATHGSAITFYNVSGRCH